MKNRNYMFLLSAATLIVNTTYVFPTVIGDILLPPEARFSNQEVGLYGVLYGLFGIAGGLLVALYLTKKQAVFKQVGIFISILAILTFVIF